MAKKDPRDIARALKCERDGKCYHAVCPYMRNADFISWDCARSEIYDDAIEVVDRACVECKYYREDIPGYFVCLCVSSPTFNRHVEGNFYCAKFKRK